jgi:hypothetical protein
MSVSETNAEKKVKTEEKKYFTMLYVYKKIKYFAAFSHSLSQFILRRRADRAEK